MNNQCCNGPISKWCRNNTIGEPASECESCGNLIHIKCTINGKFCNKNSLNTKRTIQYGSDNIHVFMKDVSNTSIDDDIPIPRRGPSDITDTDNDNSFGKPYNTPTRVNIQSDFFKPVLDKLDPSYLDKKLYEELDAHIPHILSRITCNKTHPKPNTSRRIQRKHE